MFRFVIAAIISLSLLGCASTSNSGKSVDARRNSIESMRAGTLNKLYKEKPYAADTIERAAGYAVFSNANVNLIIASAGGGYGVVHSNSGQVTYMKMGEVGLGLGLVDRTADCVAIGLGLGLSLGLVLNQAHCFAVFLNQTSLPFVIFSNFKS